MNTLRDLWPIAPMAALALLFSIVVTNARGNYPNGFPTDPDFFPIGVWLQAPSRAPAYKTIGINTFAGLWKGPTEQQLATLSKYDMFVITSQNDIGLHSINNGIIRGWLHDDGIGQRPTNRLGPARQLRSSD